MSVVTSIFKFLQFNKKNWKAVALSLLAATIFWFFNTLNKTYTTILSFPLEFQYDQDNFVPVSNLPEDVKMNVTGNGWTLLRHSASVKISSLHFPLERPNEVKKIVGSTLPSLFSNQLTNLQINFVVTDTLHVDIEPNDGRWLSLNIGDFANNIKKGYGLSALPTITPDSIFVEGPRRIVEELIEPYPVPVTTRDIDENSVMNVEIPFANDRLVVKPSTVTVTLKISKLIAVNDSVSVAFINMPRASKQVIDVRYIHYTLLLPADAEYMRENITATLSLENLKGRKVKLAPTVLGIPPFSKIIKIDSIQVSY